MTTRLSNDEVVDRALEALRAARVATAEVFVRDALSGSVETKDGALEVVTARGERGLGVRVLDGQRIGFAHTSDLAVPGIEACVEQARRMATITEPDEDLRRSPPRLSRASISTSTKEGSRTARSRTAARSRSRWRPRRDPWIRASRTSARRATATRT